MSAGLGFFQLATLALATFAIGFAGLSALVYPPLRKRIAGLAPAFRALLLGAWAAAPLLGAGILTVVCLVPDQIGLFGIADHCLEHPGHHHLCLDHAAFPTGAMSWAGLIAIFFFVAAAAALHLPSALKARRTLSALRSVSRNDLIGGVSVVPSEQPFAAALGLAKPTVYLSSALVGAVEPAVLEVIRAHESAHLRRRDPLRLAAARVVSLLHLPSVRRVLLTDLLLACEQAADRDAAVAVGDPVRVAQALLDVERLLKGSNPLVAGVAFAAGHLSARVNALVATPRATMGLAARLALVVAIGLAMTFGAALSARPLHHATETLLTLITR